MSIFFLLINPSISNHRSKLQLTFKVTMTPLKTIPEYPVNHLHHYSISAHTPSPQRICTRKCASTYTPKHILINNIARQGTPHELVYHQFTSKGWYHNTILPLQFNAPTFPHYTRSQKQRLVSGNNSLIN